MKTLEEHDRERQDIIPTYPCRNNIACPECGEELYDRDSFILTSSPAKKSVVCLKCKYTGYRLL